MKGTAHDPLYIRAPEYQAARKAIQLEDDALMKLPPSEHDRFIKVARSHLNLKWPWAFPGAHVVVVDEGDPRRCWGEI